MKILLINLIKVVYVLIITIKEIKANAKILEYFQQPGQHLHLNRKTTQHRILEMGYSCEEHEVLTEDGYYISIYRITHSPKQTLPSSSTISKPKVFIQHGLFGTADVWLINGPDDGLPFLLADRGYDVWLGNSRGNLYGRKHKNLTIHDDAFWRFSWHEIGYYDLAAMFDYVLQNETEAGKKSLHYIGHSQGGTVATVLLSLRPEYQDKLKTVQLLAPAVFLENSKDPLLRVLSPYMGYHNTISEKFSHQEFVPFNELFNALAYSVCSKDQVLQAFCSPMAIMIQGTIVNQNLSALHLCMESTPGGISTEQLLHFMQVHYTSSFRQYDFGSIANYARYNQTEPPCYPLGNITKLVHIWYGEDDDTVPVSNMEKMMQHMPIVKIHRIPDDLWTHGDFLFNLYVRQLANEPLIGIVDDYESQRVKV